MAEKKTIKVVFDNAGTFQANWAAEAWCRNNGISYGSMCGSDPRGLLYGDFRIAKWRNLTPSERKACDGTMTATDWREGPVTVEIREQ